MAVAGLDPPTYGTPATVIHWASPARSPHISGEQSYPPPSALRTAATTPDHRRSSGDGASPNVRNVATRGDDPVPITAAIGHHGYGCATWAPTDGWTRPLELGVAEGEHTSIGGRP